ncbi:MAG: hypothetical protein ACI91O_001800, partial [Candidatus Poriferisodalaceae bacterium]
LAEWLGRSSSETDALAETGVLAKQDPIADRR